MKNTTSKRSKKTDKGWLAVLLVALIGLLGFHSCTKPDDADGERGTIPDTVRLMYGPNPAKYIKNL